MNYVILDTRSNEFLFDAQQNVFHAELSLAERFDTEELAQEQVERTYLNEGMLVELMILPVEITVTAKYGSGKLITPPWMGKFAIRARGGYGGGGYYRARHYTELALSHDALAGTFFDTMEEAEKMAVDVRATFKEQGRSDIIVTIVAVEDVI